MKVNLLLSEAATAHSDGTVSILRAGIRKLQGKALPVAFQGCLVVRIELAHAEGGAGRKHAIEIRTMDEDGKDLGFKLQGSFETSDGGGESTLLLGFGLLLKRFGKYVFHINVDNVTYDSWTLSVEPVPSAPAKDQGGGK